MPDVDDLLTDLACVVLQGEIVTCMKMLGAKDLSELGPRFVSLSLSSPDSPHVSAERVRANTVDPRSTPEWWSAIFTTVALGSTHLVCGHPVPSSEMRDMAIRSV